MAPSDEITKLICVSTQREGPGSKRAARRTLKATLFRCNRNLGPWLGNNCSKCISSVLKIERSAAHLLLDIVHKHALRDGNKRVPAFSEVLHQALNEAAKDNEEWREALRNSRVCGTMSQESITRPVVRLGHGPDRHVHGGHVDRPEHELHRHVHGEHVERLKHGLCHAYTIGLGVQRNIREQGRMFLGRKKDCMRRRVARVHDTGRRASQRKKKRYGLDRRVHGGHVDRHGQDMERRNSSDKSIPSLCGVRSRL